MSYTWTDRGLATKVCDLPSGDQLHADCYGRPFYLCPPRGLRPAGYVAEVLSSVDYADFWAVDAWQRNPFNDCLRARGDIRWQAACSFTQRNVWPDTIPNPTPTEE